MKGYYIRPEEPAHALRDGWFHTVDIACMNERGWTFIIDSAKDMKKYKGYSVFPREVEEFLSGNTRVQEAAVIGVPHKDTGERVKAFIVFRPGFAGRISEQDIITWGGENMGHYKVPGIIEFRDELPRTIIGKVSRRVLREEELIRNRNE